MNTRISALSVAVVTMLAASPVTAQEVYFDANETYSVPVEGAPALGPADAPVTIVEFSDFYCGYCRQANGVLRQLMRLYQGRLRLVFMHAPLDRDDGTLPAEASLAAAAQGRFWPMHDRIFAGGRDINAELLERYAAEIGLDVLRFRSDLHGGNQRAQLQRDVARAEALGVRSTPTFFVNGKPVVGARDLGTFVNSVEEALASARAARTAGTPATSIYSDIVKSGKRRGGSTPGTTLTGPGLVAGQRYPVSLGIPSHRVGSPDAPIILEEFSDLQCPYCARVHPIVSALQEKYGDKLMLVYRHFPLAFHGDAALAAEAVVEAGAQGKFLEYQRVLAVNPDNLGRTHLERYAASLGLDLVRFRQALDDRRHMPAVAADMAEGAKLGVRGTPSLFVNGIAVIGAKPLATFTEIIDAELQRLSSVAKNPARDLPKASPAAQQDTSGDREPYMQILLACRNRDDVQAKKLYAVIKDRKQRRLIRQDCRSMGIELPK